MSEEGAVKTVELFGTAVTVGTSNAYPMPRGPATFQVTVKTTSTGGSAVIQGGVTVQASNDNVGWVPYGTCLSTGSGTATDGFAAIAPWAYIRMVITTLTTGISAELTGRIGL